MRILVDIEKCTGCKSCELICYFTRAQSVNPGLSRIKVVSLEDVGISNPVVCIQCKRPRCVEVCPTEALSKTPAGTIALDIDKCSGCKICVTECIIGAINFDEEKGLPLICDLCGDTPQCVAWCPTEALSLNNDSKDLRKKAVSYTLTRVKPILNKRGIPASALEWYKQFA